MAIRQPNLRKVSIYARDMGLYITVMVTLNFHIDLHCLIQISKKFAWFEIKHIYLYFIFWIICLQKFKWSNDSSISSTPVWTIFKINRIRWPVGGAGRRVYRLYYVAPWLNGTPFHIIFQNPEQCYRQKQVKRHLLAVCNES